jgi:hypothetical protein
MVYQTLACSRLVFNSKHNFSAGEVIIGNSNQTGLLLVDKSTDGSQGLRKIEKISPFRSLSPLFFSLRSQFPDVSRRVGQRYRSRGGRHLVPTLDENLFSFGPYIKGLYPSDFQILSNNAKDLGVTYRHFMASLRCSKPRREATDFDNYRVGTLNCQN